MNRHDKMINPLHWSKLETANRTEMLVHLGKSPLAEKHLTDELAWVITGVLSNDYNGVAWFRLAKSNVNPIIAEILGRFSSREVPFVWHMESDSQPADLARRLEVYGCRRLRPGVCMGADLSTLNEKMRNVPGLVIKRVVDAVNLAAWMDVWMHFDDGEREPRERLYASLGLDGDQPLRHYLARLDGQPVGVSQLFLSQDAAGLYCVGTLPEVQRQGIGTALTLMPLRDARTLGYRLSVLGPTRESQRMYQRIGFELFPGTSADYYR